MLELMDYGQKHKKLVHNRILFPGSLNLQVDSIHSGSNQRNQSNIVEDHIRKLENLDLSLESKTIEAKKMLVKV